VPKLNEEHTAFAWVKPGDVLGNYPIPGAGSGVSLAGNAPTVGVVQ